MKKYSDTSNNFFLNPNTVSFDYDIEYKKQTLKFHIQNLRNKIDELTKEIEYCKDELIKLE